MLKRIFLPFPYNLSTTNRPLLMLVAGRATLWWKTWTCRCAATSTGGPRCT